MPLYRFQEEDTARFAITGDAGGARLPAMGAVWRFAGPAEPPFPGRLGPDPVRVRAEIVRKGYYLWPDDAPAAAEPRSFGSAGRD